MLNALKLIQKVYQVRCLCILWGIRVHGTTDRVLHR